jgi:hypothetical protein
MSYKHQKIVIESSSSLGTTAFADYYSYGCTDGSPMICYIGGSITPSEYSRRQYTEPLSIVSAFETAWKREPPAVDLLILSAPPSGPHLLDERLTRTRVHLLGELLPQTGNPRPPAMAFLGNSYGAHLASYLTFSLAPAIALATIAGGGMAEGAISRTQDHIEDKCCHIFSNLEDGTNDEDVKFIQFLEGKGVSYKLDRREGGHPFADYERNGSVVDAFKFLLMALATD